ncbi:MAG TPA: hypothetical protein VMA77_06915 [Solirubrobacteraceae bacterium]|nr:hypothetical protein [Solirubrobacteraceae bacterium]
MNLKRSPAASPVSTLVDAVMDGYVDWREESAAVELAYRRWAQAPSSDREVAFDVYRAALDREESAAREYRRLIEHAEAAQR